MQLRSLKRPRRQLGTIKRWVKLFQGKRLELLETNTCRKSTANRQTTLFLRSVRYSKRQRLKIPLLNNYCPP